MIDSLLIGIGGIVIMMVMWVLVQGLWRKIFVDHLSDDDVLAGRSNCGNCHCTTICNEKMRELSAHEFE